MPMKASDETICFSSRREIVVPQDGGILRGLSLVMEGFTSRWLYLRESSTLRRLYLELVVPLVRVISQVLSSEERALKHDLAVVGHHVNLNTVGLQVDLEAF